MKTTCLHCKIEFLTRSTKRRYCTHICYSSSRIGEKRKNLDLRGDKNPNWRGGRRIDKDGYVLIHAPYHPYCNLHGYVREHRLVMEKNLVRVLLPEEVVHHKNELVSDNRIENLELMTKETHDALPGHFGDRSPANLRGRLLGKKQSPEAVAKRVAKLRGQKRTPEQLVTLSAALRGKKKTPEHREALRQAALRRYRSKPNPDWVNA